MYYFQSILFKIYLQKEKLKCLSIIKYEKTSLEASIEIRHDIVHRDGRTKENLDSRHKITAEMVMALAEDVRKIITSIGEQYHQKNSPQSLPETVVNIEL